MLAEGRLQIHFLFGKRVRKSKYAVKTGTGQGLGHHFEVKKSAKWRQIKSDSQNRGALYENVDTFHWRCGISDWK